VKTGEYIELSWEDEPQFYVVKGWVSIGSAIDSIHPFSGTNPDGMADHTRHSWCRWQMAGQDEWGNRKRELHHVPEGGRGCFRCTVYVPAWCRP
jgi:hypothetical protein